MLLFAAHVWCFALVIVCCFSLFDFLIDQKSTYHTLIHKLRVKITLKLPNTLFSYLSTFKPTHREKLEHDDTRVRDGRLQILQTTGVDGSSQTEDGANTQDAQEMRAVVSDCNWKNSEDLTVVCVFYAHAKGKVDVVNQHELRMSLQRLTIRARHQYARRSRNESCCCIRL